MRRFTLLFLLALSITSGAYAEVELFTFSAYAVVDHTRLEWSTGNEGDLNTFIIERSSDGSYFIPVGQKEAEGSFSMYQFTDGSPLDADAERIFYYRLKMVNRDGTYRYSDIEEVALTFSAVQQTWGTIKAMFR
jgi:hypothetical protein